MKMRYPSLCLAASPWCVAAAGAIALTTIPSIAHSRAAVRVSADSSTLAGQRKIRSPLPQADRSDYTGRMRWVYQELRDRKVALFIDKLPEGVWQIRYDLRAEAPGTFHALPVVAQAMYVPEIRSNGTEVRLTVEDKK